MSVSASATTEAVRAAAVWHVGSKQARLAGWAGAEVEEGSGMAIFEPGLDAPAFYELRVRREGIDHGYLIVRATVPFDVVQYAERGEGPAHKLARDARVARVYRLDPAVYAGEDAQGELVSPKRSFTMIDRSKPAPEQRLVEWAEAKARFPEARRDLLLRTTGLRKQSWWSDWFGEAPAGACTVSGLVPAYSQLGSGEGPNTSSCASGCGATAWAMIFGWASLRAQGSESYTGYAGLVRSGSDMLGSPIKAPERHEPIAWDLMWNINQSVNTRCLGDSGATTFFEMAWVSDYVAPRAPGVAVEVDFNSLAIAAPYVRDQVINAICDGRPAIVGTGSIFDMNLHYPVAWAYDTGWFYLNMGWGGDSDAWYSSDTFFYGSVRLQ